MIYFNYHHETKLKETRKILILKKLYEVSSYTVKMKKVYVYISVYNNVFKNI